MSSKNTGKSHERPICGAKTKSGGRCRCTVLYPNGRCRMHGGAAGRPITHGLYSQVVRNQLRDRLDAAGELDQPFDLQGELALMRALLQDVLARMDGSIYRAELEKVLEKYFPELPDRVLIAQQIAELLPHVDDNYLPAVLHLTNQIRRIIATIAKIRNDTALTIAEVRFLQAGIIGLIDDFLPDPDKKRAFIARLTGIIPRATAGQ